MTPDEFRQTQRGGRWYQLWLRERNPLRKAEYQRLFNEDLKKINGEVNICCHQDGINQDGSVKS